MQTVVVDIEDVYPDEANVRKTFTGIDELAESMHQTPTPDGRTDEPITPPLLVKDGGIYRILDGERRYRAMRKLRKKRFTANVVEGVEEYQKVLDMLTMDTHRQDYDQADKDRGIQQALLLGIDPVKVEKASGARNLAKARRGMSKAKDAAADMSIDRLIAIADLTDEGASQEQVDAVMSASETEWEGAARRVRDAMVRARRAEALRAKLDELGVQALDTELGEEWTYRAGESTVDGIERVLGGEDPTEWAASLDGCWCCLYSKGSGRNEEQERMMRERDRLQDTMAQSRRKRARWLGGIVNGLNDTKGTMLYANSQVVRRVDAAFKDRYGGDIEDFDAACGTCAGRCSNEITMALGLHWAERGPSAATLLNGKAPAYDNEVCKAFKAYIAAYLSDGYAPSTKEEQDFFNLVSALEVG